MRFYDAVILTACLVLAVGCASIATPPQTPNVSAASGQYIVVQPHSKVTQAKTIISDGASFDQPFVAKPGELLFSTSTSSVSTQSVMYAKDAFAVSSGGFSHAFEADAEYPLAYRAQINGRHVSLIRVPVSGYMGRDEAFLTVNHDGTLAGHVLVGDADRLGGKLLLASGFKPKNELLFSRRVPSTRALGQTDYVFSSSSEELTDADLVVVDVYGYKNDGSRFLLQKMQVGSGRLAPCGPGCRIAHMKAKAGHVFVVQGAN